MSRPKNRNSVFIVVRTRFAQNDGDVDTFHTVGVYRTLEAAENIRDAFTQEMIDSNLKVFHFDVQISNYYDE